MKIALLIYLIGLVPAYLCLRHSFIRLCGVAGRTTGDAMLMMLTTLFSWITVLVALTMMTVLSIGDIDGEPPKAL